ncbi:hypothetical protein IT575_00845 [bacterium]|nr:hypothetical protein [bacterium]
MSVTRSARQCLRSGLLPVLALLLILSALAAGCGGALPASDSSGLRSSAQLRLVAAPESDWQASDVEISLSPLGGGAYELSLTSLAAAPASQVLLECYLPQGMMASEAEQLAPQGRLNLLVSGREEVLALGIIAAPGQAIAPGRLLRAVLRPTAAGLRKASKLPPAASCTVSNLSGTEDGLGGFSLGWSYRNSGDYNQDGRVSIADLAQIGIHFGLQSDTFPGPFPAGSIGDVVDGNADGQVAIGDLTPIGINFLNQIDAYRIYRADSSDPVSALRTLVGELPSAEGQAPSDARRAYSFPVPAAELVLGQWYFVEPYELAGGAIDAPSNTVQYTASSLVKFRVPATAGGQIADAVQAQSPSLVMMPGIPGLAQPGAPVVLYTALGGGGGLSPLYLCYYGEAGWTTEEVGGGGNFAGPHAMWIEGEGDDPGHGMVIAYSQDSQKLVQLDFDSQWQYTGTTDIDNGGGVFFGMDVDRDPASGTIGVAHAYTGLGTGSVDYSYLDSSGVWQSQGVYDGETVGGLTLAFDRQGGDPWLLFTHGTINTSGVLSLQFSLEQGRRSGGTWNLSAVPHPDSPLLLDLGFAADGTPQLAFTAARDFTIPIPGNPFTASLLFDVNVADWNGSAWVFDNAYESTFGISLDILGGTATLELNLASDVSWAKADELCYSKFIGDITVGITDFIPQDGSIDGDAQYMRRQGAFVPSGYYDGDSARSFSWGLNPEGQPCCACVRSLALSATDLFEGNFSAAGELYYWQP